jgi:hypothetical protein
MTRMYRAGFLGTGLSTNARLAMQTSTSNHASGRAGLKSLCEILIRSVIPSEARNLALSIFKAVAHTRLLTGTQKP